MTISRTIHSLLLLLGLALAYQGARPVLAADADSSVSETLLEKMVRLSDQIDSINARIVDLESEFGPFDRSLLEPLRDLALVNLEMGDFNEVEAILERRLQLVRTSEGPSSLTQSPIIEELIANDLRRQDWQSVSNRYRLLQDLNSQNSQVSQAENLQSRYDVALWEFAQLYLDQPARKIKHFQDGRESLRRTVDLAEEMYGDDSMELVPWFYRDALMKFQVAAAIVADDELGVDARDEIVRREGRTGSLGCATALVAQGNPLIFDPLNPNYSPPVCRTGTGNDQRSLLQDGPGASYLREGLSSIERMAEIARINGDLEAEAMALTYEADFRLLLGLGRAERGYRRAIEKFVEAGIPRQQVNEFFQRPVVLPRPEYYSRMVDAIDSQDAAGFQKESGESTNAPAMDLGRFSAWSDSLPFAWRPAVPESAAGLDAVIDYHEVEIEFALSSRGHARSPDIGQSSTDSSRVRRSARQALRNMQFRPFLVDGNWQRVDNLRIRYLVPVN